MSNQPTPITDDEIRSVLYRMAAHVSFFAEPRTPDPKAAAFADALMSAVSASRPSPDADMIVADLVEAHNKMREVIRKSSSNTSKP